MSARFCGANCVIGRMPAKPDPAACCASITGCGKAADFSAAFSMSDQSVALPTGAESESETDAPRSNADTDARAAIIVAIAASVIPVARVVVVAVTILPLNDDAATASRTVAAAGIVTDQSDILDAVVRHHGEPVRQRCGAGS